VTAHVDYVVVGSGLTGATIARVLHDAGWRVQVLERRAHLGGNVHEHRHPSGIRIHTYGPHYFRTNSEELWAFVNRFGAFHPFVAEVRTEVEGAIEAWPVTADYIRRVAGEGWRPECSGTPQNFEEASLAMMPGEIYRRFVRGYTEKQWGVSATSLSADLAKRFDVRHDGDTRLMRHRYQGIPVEGYDVFMARVLEGIPCELGVDYLAERAQWTPTRRVIFTGPIDEYYGYDLGRLAYRGQQRTHEYRPDVAGVVLPVGQVNNPDPARGAHIRTLEWKHMMPPDEVARVRGTVLTRETPFSPEEPSGYEYPFPDAVNRVLYERYRTRADADAGVLICGRLGEYRYYDMDQAIARARVLAGRLLAAG